MLRITVNFNSAVEDVLNFKTCCGLQAQDQNLEIMITNQGDESISVLPYFDLEDQTGLSRISGITPADGLSIGPGEIKAMYCQLDESRYRTAQRLILYDSKGRFYPTKRPDLTPR